MLIGQPIFLEGPTSAAREPHFIFVLLVSAGALFLTPKSTSFAELLMNVWERDIDRVNHQPDRDFT